MLDYRNKMNCNFFLGKIFIGNLLGNEEIISLLAL